MQPTIALDVLLLNPPYITLTSTRGVGHQVPLGLLMVGGALLDAGFSVELLDAECRHLSIPAIVAEVGRRKPHVIMSGHAGSTPAHSVCIRTLRAIKAAHPSIRTVYGGPFPTYHAAEILSRHDAVDTIVRGEGEATAVDLLQALRSGRSLDTVASLAFRDPIGRVVITPERPPLRMDDYRIGWELLDANQSWDDYQCFGLGRAVIVQFSRGCPHQCTYCGQRGFWMKWRHRDPLALVDEIEWLVRKRHVRFITLADENPTTLQAEWRIFLEGLARRQLPVKFFATIRASDIVRDAAFISLYRDAGLQYILMGIETTDAATLAQIKKGSTTRIDFQACRLLRQHGIFSIIGHIVGFENETWRTFIHAGRQLAVYDGDYLNAMYVTPHAWTAFARDARHRLVIDADQSHWDYRHQILAQHHLRPWQLFMAVKILELVFHLRPRRLWRLLSQSSFSRRQFIYGLHHTGMVWLGEIISHLSNLAKLRPPARPLARFYPTPIGPQHHEQRLHSLRIRGCAITDPVRQQASVTSRC